MKGLLIKDFKLLTSQKNFFVIIAAVAVIMAVSMNDVTFLLGYLTFVMPIFALTTLSYDEFDNGNAFLFTLPISRKEYVFEKYLFSLILGICAFAFATVLSLALGFIREIGPVLDALKGAPVMFCLMLIFLSLMIPMQLKFGAEKGRIAMIGAVGIIFALGFSAIKIAELFKVDLFQYIDRLLNSGLGLLIAISIAAVALISVISIEISIRIIEKKEF